MHKLLVSIVFAVLLTSCATNPKQSSVHHDQLVAIPIAHISQVEYVTPGLQHQIATHVTPVAPNLPLLWMCGINHQERVMQTTVTNLRIVGVTEQFVPLTGEQIGIVYHVQLSPLDASE